MKATHTPTGQEVEAVQWNKTNFKEIWNLTNGQVHKVGRGYLLLRMNGGSWAVDAGEWVIKTSDGDLHVHTDQYFKGFYKEKCEIPVGESPMK